METKKGILKWDKELTTMIEIIQEASKILLKYYGGNRLDTHYKTDQFDPVTQADLESEKYIDQKMKKYFPDDKILSEETQNKLRDFSGRVRMIDPLDGTKEFIQSSPFYALMIGLCINGIPTVGVVSMPSTGRLFFARKGKGAYLMSDTEGIRKLQVSDTDSISEFRHFSKSKFSEMRTTNEKIQQTFAFKEILDGGSVGAILSTIAAGEGECYILTNRKTSKRDSCAAQVILEEAGGKVTDIIGEKVDYLTGGSSLPNLLVASNGRLHEELIEKIQEIFREL